MDGKEYTLSCKSGKQVSYRGVRKEDAEALYQHQCTIARETYFTALYPDEIIYNIEREIERIQEIQNHPVNFQIVTTVDERIVGQAECVQIKRRYLS